MHMTAQWYVIDKCHMFFNTVNIMTKLLSSSGDFLEFLNLSPSILKGIEKDRLTLRLYKPLVERVKSQAEANNISVNSYLELAVLEKLKVDALTEIVDKDIDSYSLLQNKSVSELDFLKTLLSQTLQDNQRLKQAVEQFRSTAHGDEFDSFELF